jgi:Dimerisation domain
MSAATSEHIMQVGLGFWGFKVLLSAVEIGLFSAFSAADLPTLQRKLALHQRSARDVLDALVALKLLERTNGVYRNTADTDLFLDHPNHHDARDRAQRHCRDSREPNRGGWSTSVRPGVSR